MPRNAATTREAGKRTAAEKVLALVGAFARGGGALTLTEIARHADLSLTTAHRLTREVLEWGGLEVDDSGHYRLSRKFLELASTSTPDFRLREHALPHLVDLHRLTGLTVHFAVADGDDVMYLEALRAHSNYTGENRIGGRLKLHVTATGLVLLAHADPAFVDDYLSRPLKRYTPHTLAEPDVVRSFLEEVRRNRFAIVERPVALAAGAIAAPVCGEYGEVVAAVGIVYVIDRDEPAKLLDLVRATAARISHALTDKRTPPPPQTIDFNRRSAGLI